MSKISRRSFLSVTAAASGSSMLRFAQAGGVIPGLDQAKTGDDTTHVWKPYSDRKPRVDVIDALNMTVPGYYAHLSSMKDVETMKIPQYSL